MKSTPTIWEAIISLMALPPAPPTPNTLILADNSLGTNCIFIGDPLGTIIACFNQSYHFAKPFFNLGHEAAAGGAPVTAVAAGPAVRGTLGFLLTPETVQGQSHCGGVGRVVDHVDEAADPHGIADPGVHVKGFAGQLHQAVHQGRATHQDRT